MPYRPFDLNGKVALIVDVDFIASNAARHLVSHVPLATAA